ncbi:bifunctional nicotinamidase/pyrazinamidase [Anditalea andensis]|uniref:Nicotinamidase n=1 Tax=Anditalea andensis TaxID=1048983 RepID=A0A074L169_9BACT|nr:bifunctional nicotinamidase/pyrazinamidase [Anditalea andensis]KEO74215.1 PncA [Anditalea andensis]
MKALLIVDVQYDFLPGGALPVEEGDKIIPVINEIQEQFQFIVATQDWHPPKHGSFAASHDGYIVGDMIQLGGIDQILWPVHCVQDTKGAEFHSSLHTKKWARIFQKGTDILVDSYSGFYDNNRKKDTGLAAYLNKHGVKEVYVVGLAADYCVKFTVLDALKEGFHTFLFKDATRAVNIRPGDFEAALQEMQEAGAVIVDSSVLLNL